MSAQLSLRHQVADEIAEAIRGFQLCNPFGGDVTLSQNRRYYCVLFSYPRHLDGLVSVFSEKFIIIKWQTGYRYLPAHGTIKLTTVADAIKFIKAAFVDHDEKLVDELREQAT